MRCRDAKKQFTAPRVSYPVRPLENDDKDDTGSCSPHLQQPEQHLESTSSRQYPTISTARIMQAVEQQRRISQQLEDLQARQKQRTAFLRTAGLKLLVVFWSLGGVLAVAFVTLLIVRPEFLAHVLDWLGGGIALLLLVEDELKQELALIPAASWVFSGIALLIVLMMALWVRLMRHPREI